MNIQEMESSPVSQDLFSRVVLDYDWIQHHFGRKKRKEGRKQEKRGKENMRKRKKEGKKSRKKQFIEKHF